MGHEIDELVLAVNRRWQVADYRDGQWEIVNSDTQQSVAWMSTRDLISTREQENSKVDINAIYHTESKYLKAEDLSGARVPVEIDSWEVVSVDDDGKERSKVVLYFKGKQKGLMLNVTNATAIAGAHGTEVDRWVGKCITLYPTTTQYAGKVVDCIRVEAMPDVAEDEVLF